MESDSDSNKGIRMVIVNLEVIQTKEVIGQKEKKIRMVKKLIRNDSRKELCTFLYLMTRNADLRGLPVFFYVHHLFGCVSL